MSTTDEAKRELQPEMKERMQMVERIVKLFQLERRVYLVATVVCCLFLVFVAVSLLIRSTESTGVVIAMFGSSGVVAFSVGRTLYMFNKALSAVLGD